MFQIFIPEENIASNIWSHVDISQPLMQTLQRWKDNSIWHQRERITVTKMYRNKKDLTLTSRSVLGSGVLLPVLLAWSFWGWEGTGASWVFYPSGQLGGLGSVLTWLKGGRWCEYHVYTWPGDTPETEWHNCEYITFPRTTYMVGKTMQVELYIYIDWVFCWQELQNSWCYFG